MTSTTIPTGKDIPDDTTVAAAAKLEILNVKGEKITFGSLFENQKTIVVFVRHFFCGTCQAYVSQLANVSEEALVKANTKIVVIGCGEWNPIEHYAETTDFKGPIYADPSRSLYRTLSMVEGLGGTPADQDRKSYLTKGAFTNAAHSTWRALKNPTLIGKQGNISQLGGDFIFGPGLNCSFAYRMQHTEDHTETAEFLKEAGVEVA